MRLCCHNIYPENSLGYISTQVYYIDGKYLTRRYLVYPGTYYHDRNPNSVVFQIFYATKYSKINYPLVWHNSSVWQTEESKGGIFLRFCKLNKDLRLRF
jgi:hypothetical protein